MAMTRRVMCREATGRQDLAAAWLKAPSLGDRDALADRDADRDADRLRGGGGSDSDPPSAAASGSDSDAGS